ncbi:MAG: hypothetical protein JXA57_05795 [Armatimonadetes bacterium]|nr:hypothetical protein [Armatimonadota bacterium]
MIHRMTCSRLEEELRQDLEDARLTLAAIIRAAGGRLVVPRSCLVEASRRDVISRWEDLTNRAVVYELEPEGPLRSRGGSSG